MSGGLKGKKVIVQGLGNVGYHASKFLSYEDGVVVIAVLKRDGAIIDMNGIDIDKLYSHIKSNNSIVDYPGYVKSSPELLEMDCDIFIPAAVEGVITEENASRIKARIIIEAANGPITFNANEILRDKGCLIIPDLYANAGGVTASYFEWVKNIGHIRLGRLRRREEERKTMLMIKAVEDMTGQQFPEGVLNKITAGTTELDLVRSGLEDTMREGYRVIGERWHSDERVLDLRTAAMMISLERVVASYKSLGI